MYIKRHCARILKSQLPDQNYSNANVHQKPSLKEAIVLLLNVWLCVPHGLNLIAFKSHFSPLKLLKYKTFEDQIHSWKFVFSSYYLLLLETRKRKKGDGKYSITNHIMNLLAPSRHSTSTTSSNCVCNCI